LDKLVVDWNKFVLERMDVSVERREMTYSHIDALDVIGRDNFLGLEIIPTVLAATTTFHQDLDNILIMLCSPCRKV
jgi:hypothetical protein